MIPLAREQGREGEGGREWEGGRGREGRPQGVDGVVM